jgi:enterochelin esterase-like enzyme
VLEPQSTLLFLLLMVAFGALVLWLAMTKQVVFRVLAACLAFIPAMAFGIAAVNKYYDYYQTWGALFSDLSGQAPQSIPQLSAAGLGTNTGNALKSAVGSSNSAALDAQLGLLFQTKITGPSSHITRQVYIYLPPQYFSKAYAHYTFPAVELLHGSPGEPQTWINVMDVIPIYQQLLAEHKAAPAVLVMPNTDGGLQYALQCLNDPHGLQDMTFVGKEVPNWVAANLRVQKPGLMWGIAGYSEGGFCAANIGLQYPTRFGFAGSLSGYFAPTPSQVPLDGKPNGRPQDVNVYAHNSHLTLVNTPDEYILHIPIGVQIPQFFLAAGLEDQGDVLAAENFQQLLLTRLADVPLMKVRGGGHQALVWRAALGPMLSWMTAQQAQLVQHFAQIAANERAAAKAAAHHPRPKVTLPATARPATVGPTTARPTTVRPTPLSPAPPAPGLSTGTLPSRRPPAVGEFRCADRLVAHAGLRR